ncbi:MAG TPA: histidine kinase dimerization/phosphoacceptor domain -containing protein [Puia sp.]|nr:histidine kinase dimerization/phosphoacceptor domain -containing protein [Puia sp.]
MLLSLIGLRNYGQGVSREWADSLLKQLNEGTPDTVRMYDYFMAAQAQIFKAGENEIDLDSAEEYMRKAALINKKTRSADADAFQVLLQSLLARDRHQEKRGKELAEEAVNLLKNTNNKYYLGTSYFTLSDYFDYNDPKESGEKIRLVELAIQAFHQSDNIEQEAYCLKYLADLYALNNERAKALEKLDLSLQLYDSIHYASLHAVYILYSHVYFTDGDYKQALKYGLMALNSALTAGDTSLSLCEIYNYIGTIFDRLKEGEKAIDYYNRALAVAEKNKDNSSVLQVMANIVNTYIALKRPDEALAFMKALPQNFIKPIADRDYIYTPLSYLNVYNEQKRFPQVDALCSQILHLIKFHLPPDDLLHNFYFILIRHYLQSGQYSLAETHIGTLDSLSKKIGDPYRIKDGLYLRFRLDTAQGHYKEAAKNLLKYQALNDSLFTETASRQMKQLEVEYETKKNKNEITVLSQQNQLQRDRLDQEALVRKFIIGGVALMFIIIGLLYRQYRHKQKNNRIILQKNEQLQHFLNEKEWLVKEIHHRVKNNFHIVASLLEIQSSYLKNQEAISAIQESQHRIYAMSIIHQKLYQSDTLSIIYMPDYIYELVEYLRDSYSIRENVSFSLQIENIELNHGTAITLGLILNEAITNAIKYAFAGTKEGKISIALTHISDLQLLLSITDNGRGLPIDFESKIGTSMGMELLQGLTDDLGGSLIIETKNGTYIKVIFGYRPISSPNSSFSQ